MFFTVRYSKKLNENKRTVLVYKLIVFNFNFFTKGNFIKKFVVCGAFTALAVSLTGCGSNTYETSVEDN